MPNERISKPTAGHLLQKNHGTVSRGKSAAPEQGGRHGRGEMVAGGTVSARVEPSGEQLEQITKGNNEKIYRKEKVLNGYQNCTG